MHVTLGTLVLTKALKTRLQAAQDECVRFCLKLGDRKRITVKELKKINCLPIHDAFFIIYINLMPKKHPIIWMKFISHAECNRIPTRYSYQKLKLPIAKQIKA